MLGAEPSGSEGPAFALTPSICRDPPSTSDLAIEANAESPIFVLRTDQLLNLPKWAKLLSALSKMK